MINNPIEYRVIVHRPMGGLEIDVDGTEAAAPVHRPMGGLEITIRPPGLRQTVHRPMGGLEITAVNWGSQ